MGLGTHWCSLYRGTNGLEYYDSFGLPPPKEIQHFVDVYNTVQHQKIDTKICGLLCCLYIMSRNAGHSMYDTIFHIIKKNDFLFLSTL
jgi:hypothetical protein